MSDAHEGSDADLRRDLYRIDRQTGAAENLTASLRNLDVVGYAERPSGSFALLAFDRGRSGRAYAGLAPRVCVLDADGLRDVDGAVSFEADAAGGIADGAGGSLQVLALSRGSTGLLSVSESPHWIVSPSVTVTAQASTASGRPVWAQTGHDGVVCVGSDRALVEVHRPGISVRPMIECEVRAADGHPVHGWVALPEGPGPHPAILLVHGGPYAQYGADPDEEVQILLGAGYAVIRCNPRGSAGYGPDHAVAVRGAMGSIAAGDVLGFLDGALEMFSSLDAARLGIMGGSYGGYLTAWIIARDHRFRAAVIERGWFDPEAFVGPSDIGDTYIDEYVGVTETARRAQSPQRRAVEVRTPVLVMHADQDLRCPIGESERYYLALKRAGVDAAFVVFPGEDHELTRSGSPVHRVQRLEVILDWWRKSALGSPGMSQEIG